MDNTLKLLTNDENFIITYGIIDNKEIIVCLANGDSYIIPYSVHNEKAILYKIKDQNINAKNTVTKINKKINITNLQKNINDATLLIASVGAMCMVNPNTLYLTIISILGLSGIYLRIKENKYKNLSKKLENYSKNVDIETSSQIDKLSR